MLFGMLQVLRLLIRLYEAASIPDWVNICQCLMFLDDPGKVADILDKLLKGSQVFALPLTLPSEPFRPSWTLLTMCTSR